MGTSLCSALAVAALLQAPGAPADTVAVLRARIGQDSSDAAAWLAVGRAYLAQADAGHVPGHRPPQDSAAVRATLDTADAALARAVALFGPAASPAGDSARVLRVGAWSRRSRLAWESAGISAGPQEWGPVPLDLKLPAVLDELGENLLRACPMWGVLFTARDADSEAAWYMRFARGLRPDLLVVPLAEWRSDSVLRVRIAADLKLGRRAVGGGGASLADLAHHRPVCVSMGLERPPDLKPSVTWITRPLVWVAGAPVKDVRVPPRDFVFAALRIALDGHDPWAEPALAVYARAARATPALCEALRTFKLTAEVPRCRK